MPQQEEEKKSTIEMYKNKLQIFLSTPLIVICYNISLTSKFTVETS